MILNEYGNNKINVLIKPYKRFSSHLQGNKFIFGANVRVYHKVAVLVGKVKIFYTQLLS